jgi:hypothetical protein
MQREIERTEAAKIVLKPASSDRFLSKEKALPSRATPFCCALRLQITQELPSPLAHVPKRDAAGSPRKTP